MDYNSLKKCLNKIKTHPSAKVAVIGKSVLGKNIYAVLCETCKTHPWAIITAGIHAREHLSCDLVIKLVRKFLKDNIDYGYNVAFVPLVNPDGATLAVNNLRGAPKAKKHNLMEINGSADFCLYKANAGGVDLNNNFDANWNRKFTTKNAPSSQGYYGLKPFSEPESKALAKFTKKLKPFITISYHLKGEEIYFDFFQPTWAYNRDQKIAQIFANATGYTIKSTQNGSSGGYKDWCVQKLGIPALTIELGADNFSHPYPKTELKNIYNKNKGVFDCLKTSLTIYNMEKNYGTHARSANFGAKSV